jgi:hypothetical protein
MLCKCLGLNSSALLPYESMAAIIKPIKAPMERPMNKVIMGCSFHITAGPFFSKLPFLKSVCNYFAIA